MKIDALKEYIRKTVQQEIRSVLKEELKYQLTDILLGNELKTVKSSTNSKPNNSFIEKSESLIDEQSHQLVEKPKKHIKYTSNPVLNEVLNQTQGGLPKDGEMVGLIGDGFGSSINRELINEVKYPKTHLKKLNLYMKLLQKTIDL